MVIHRLKKEYKIESIIDKKIYIYLKDEERWESDTALE